MFEGFSRLNPTLVNNQCISGCLVHMAYGMKLLLALKHGCQQLCFKTLKNATQKPFVPESPLCQEEPWTPILCHIGSRAESVDHTHPLDPLGLEPLTEPRCSSWLLSYGSQRASHVGLLFCWLHARMGR